MRKLIEVATELATKAHEGQTRKNSGVPYVEHPIQVAGLFELRFGDYVKEKHGEVVYEQAMAAAILHDVVEDTSYTLEDILKETDYGVVYYVEGLTDTSKVFYTMANRKERKAIDGARISHYSEVVHLVKFCDIVCNVSDYVRENPEYAVDVYIPEKLTFLKFLVNLSPDVSMELETFLKNNMQKAKEAIK